jgi:hypothetical protein
MEIVSGFCPGLLNGGCFSTKFEQTTPFSIISWSDLILF